jgi:hypothetical protein
MIQHRWTKAWQNRHKRKCLCSKSTIGEFSDRRSSFGDSQWRAGRKTLIIGDLEANDVIISSSGRLNAKQQELLELQALAQRRLKNVRSNFNEGLKTARETKRDLEWTEKRVR